jgi:hypothetical protein
MAVDFVQDFAHTATVAKLAAIFGYGETAMNHVLVVNSVCGLGFG